MRTVIVFLILSSIFSAYGISVPTNWNDAEQRNSADMGYINHRFSRRNDRLELPNTRPINHPLARTIPMVPQANSQMILNSNGLLIVPQTQKESPLKQNYLDYRYQREDQSFAPIKPNKKYQQLPDHVLGVQPLGVVDKYRQLKEAQKMQDMVNRLVHQYNPGLFNQYLETSGQYNALPLKNIKPLALTEEKPKNHQLIESSTSNENPSLEFKRELDHSTKKEPVFFVTEGYTNVLLQGPHHKKTYVENDESNDLPTQQKPPHKRKVTKIYRIHNNLGGSRNNLVEADQPGKARYFQKPELYEEEDRRVGLEKHLHTNYRDDTLYEPKDDKDYERDDIEDERISSDEIDDEEGVSNKDEVDDKQDQTNVTLVTTNTKEEEIEERTENSDDRKVEPKSESSVKIGKSDDETTKPQNYSNNALQEDKRDLKLENQKEEKSEYKEEDVEETEGSDDLTDKDKEVSHSEHADPKPPPTKPIYPGEGFWAKPELKHRPHISQHRFLKPVEEEQKPDGFNVFEDLERFFERQKHNFGNTFKLDEETTTVASSPFANYFESIRTPSPVRPILVYDPFTESSNNAQTHSEPIEATTEISKLTEATIAEDDKDEDNSKEDANNSEEENEELEENDEDSDDDEDEFVPLRLYTQVRNHENIEHEPYNPLEHGRLREVIKDSKVQTVYTEEGYEDAAYDHAGHEKNAEKDQGYSEFEREKEGKAEDVIADTPDNDKELSKQVSVLNDSEHVLIDSLASDSIVPKIITENDVKDSGKKNLQNNNFISTQEVKTTQVKDKPNGNMELEIESEVKVIMQPNNSSESHKYVKIYPKILKEIEYDQKTDDSIKENTNDESDVAVPRTTESSTVSGIESITKTYPKVVVKVIDESGALKTIIGEDKLQRTKRSVELSPFGGFEADLEVLKNINHTFEPSKPEIDVEKYPYYLLPDLNENSPLRYAENFDNVPKKTEGELTFYKLADQHECPEIPQNIDPVPEHVKSAHLKKGENEESLGTEDSEEGDDEEEESVVDKKQPATPKTPRIKLGDKIDCLKARYFGDNPFDSPFFKEETVGQVKPIFKDLEHIHKNPTETIASWRRSDDNIVNTNEVFDQSEKENIKIATENRELASPINLTKASEAAAESINSVSKVSAPIGLAVNDVIDEIKPTASPLVTLITTPRYTIQLTPENIYDQIKLLDHLPEDDTTTNKKPTDKNNLEDEHSQREETSQRKPKILVEDKIGPEAEALRRRRMRPRKPNYQIFDVNKFLTTTPFNLINTASTTILPKHKVISEVYYKDEIKPSEQLNVFADVLNNIKNSSKIDNVPMQSVSDFAEPSAVTIKTLEDSTIVPRESTPSIVRVKKFQSDSSYLSQNKIEVPKTTLRPPAPPRQVTIVDNHQKHYNSRQPNLSSQDFRAKILQSTSTSRPLRPSTISPKRKLLKRRRKPSLTTTTTSTLRTTTNIHIPKQNTPINHQPYIIDFIEDTDKVVGLVPPQNFEYRTIVVENSLDRDGPDSYEEQSESPKVIPVTEHTDEAPPEKPLNIYSYPGLKPPMPQKVRPYSDFFVNGALVNENLLRRRIAHVGHFRTKRDAARQSYADVSRNRGKQTAGLEESVGSDDEADDYVPHRPKNYHYDEKTGKIIYHSKPKPKEEEEDEVEYEEIEVPDTPGIYLEKAEDATHPTPEKVTTKQLLATATPPPEGKDLLDFVLKLKNNPTYEFIPDPTTSKPGSKPATTEGFTTVDPKSTDPPEFLNILSKVKSDSNYKYIEDPKETKKKSKVTTPSPEEEFEDDEEEETVPQHIQNSPGGQAQDLGNIEIFDIGDYLPKIKPVTTKTTIDYSKYKTIQRDRPKTTPSTLEEDEEDDLDLGRREEVLSKQDHSRGNVHKQEVNREEETIDRLIYSEESDEREKPTTTTTTQRIVQLRRGTRPTTSRTAIEVFEPQVATTTARARRRPITTRGTKRPILATETTEKVAKVYPANYSTDFTDQPQSASFEKAKRVYRRRPVRIRHTTERQEENDEEVDKIVRRSIDNKFDYIMDEFEKASLGR
ncbi:uncharacterized protein LOC126738056 isoform X2 [Anthonomus grandis grandis]|uniref:uncharacterized protein LOC126738056 isoform X2 n=1 Tax=Anthonomus grandis grandis TaxID=2921223 RepID=UPI0021660267|nr:uncharacterized protein LOC126738056 isoform X2 [Anthonomus grandis grandis]